MLQCSASVQVLVGDNRALSAFVVCLHSKEATVYSTFVTHVNRTVYVR